MLNTLIYLSFVLSSLIAPILLAKKFKKELTFFELVIAFVIGMSVSSITFHAIRYSKLLDVEVINGQVTDKTIVKKKCKYPGWYSISDSFCTNENTREVFSHFETIYCTDDKGNSYSCGEEAVYDTEYSYDFPWEKKYYIKTNIGEYLISRVDKQGANTPPFFENTQKGDGVSTTQYYTNYLLGLDTNILNPEKLSLIDDTVLLTVPDYPDKVYDHFKIDRLITIDADVDNKDIWNQLIRNASGILGFEKQANLIIVITRNEQDFRYAIEKKWKGGKKNDVILIIGVGEDNKKIVWVDVITFLGNKGNEFLTRYTQDAIIDVGEIDPILIVGTLTEKVLKHYDRLSMSELEDLKYELRPSFVSVMLLCLLSTLISAIVSFVLTRNEYKKK